VDQRPWYQKQNLDTAFPFRVMDSPMRSFSLHWHEPVEIVYVLEGKITVSVEKQSREVWQGGLVVINSSAIHGFSDAVPGTVLRIFKIGLGFFDQVLVDLRDKIFQKLVFDKKVFINPDEDSGLYKRLEYLLTTVCQEYLEKKEGFRLAIKTKLYELALIFLRDVPAEQPFSKETIRHHYNHRTLERIFSFIHGNYDDPDLTLDCAADAVALSKFYFTRFFKRETGQGFHAYLSSIRISRAEEYLTESDMSITDIAYQCGFGSTKTFNRLFKTYTGSSPSCYRNGRKSPAKNPR
jgi:AraC-like DNA-binding protein